MKPIHSYFITLLLSSSLLAQTTTTSESWEQVYGTPTNLTDEQTKASQEFVHQGVKDEKIKASCAEQGLGTCDPNDVDPKGFKGVLEQHIGKAYTMVFGGMGFLTGGGGPTIQMKPDAKSTTTTTEVKADAKPDAKADGAKKDGEQNTDYCMYGAMGYEMISGLMQVSAQDKAQKESAQIPDAQLAALVNLKETHKARKKTATYQATAYGAVTACYAAYGAMGASLTDWKYWAKMGGAAALTMLYVQKAKKHGNAADKVQLVIDSLPKAGDCNPWTGTSCFCSHPTSKDLYPAQYQEVCVLNNGNFLAETGSMVCGVLVNGTMQLDTECKCKQTNTCFRAVMKDLNPTLSLGQNFMSQANKGFDLLGSGEYDPAKLNTYNAQIGAMAKGLKDKVKVNGPNLKLTEDQKQAAKAFTDYMPDSVAAIAAAAPISNGPRGGGLMGGVTSSALEKIPDSMKKKLAEEVKGNYNSSGSSNSTASTEQEFTLPQFGGPAQASKNVEEISFADKALSKADVSNAPDTPIFDIISNRYRRSGWTKLEGQPK